MTSLKIALATLLPLLVAFTGCLGTTPSDPASFTTALATEAQKPPALTDEMPSPTGRFQTYSTTGSIDQTNAFFAVLGTNGRTCATCHQPQDAWTITPPHVLARFNATTPKGTDPIFRTNDGANSPIADVSTEAARQSAYSMLLTKGLIRVGIGIPAGAEFGLSAVDDPYGYASDRELSLFRRPLPTTNLGFLATVMWDGRETFAAQTINFDLQDQSNGATLGHAQAAAALNSTTQAAIVAFEAALFTCATFDNATGALTEKLGQGDPLDLSAVPFHLGINDVLGGDPAEGAPPFTPNVFTIYDNWKDSVAKTNGTDGARGAVARGMILFNTRAISITGVKGLNDKLGAPTIAGTCSTCHDTPNAGNHSLALPIDIGIADGARRTPDLPLYTLRNLTTNETVQTTDPGRALITGKWADIGKFKGPTLRALSARAPYFHNGSAAGLDDVVDFYNGRFAIGLTAAEHNDLVAFLRTL
jgi:cytochrome c peroxidase